MKYFISEKWLVIDFEDGEFIVCQDEEIDIPDGEDSFEVGQKVRAPWSNGYYYPAIIADIFCKS